MLLINWRYSESPDENSRKLPAVAVKALIYFEPTNHSVDCKSVLLYNYKFNGWHFNDIYRTEYNANYIVPVNFKSNHACLGFFGHKTKWSMRSSLKQWRWPPKSVVMVTLLVTSPSEVVLSLRTPPPPTLPPLFLFYVLPLACFKIHWKVAFTLIGSLRNFDDSINVKNQLVLWAKQHAF